VKAFLSVDIGKSKLQIEI